MAGCKDNEMPGYLNVHLDFSFGHDYIPGEQGGPSIPSDRTGFPRVYVEKLIERAPASLDSAVKRLVRAILNLVVS